MHMLYLIPIAAFYCFYMLPPIDWEVIERLSNRRALTLIVSQTTSAKGTW
jgi:hypothetical protein